MELIGTVESLWRYRFKSMRGEELAGGLRRVPWRVRGPSLCLSEFRGAKRISLSDGSRTGNDVAVSPRYGNPARMTKPDNLAEAQALGPGLTPVYPDSAGLALDVDTPSGDRLAIGDPKLIELLRAGFARRMN